MRILLDENIPHALRIAFSGHDVETAAFAELDGVKNGQLLKEMRGRFDVLVTLDRNLVKQNDVSDFAIICIVLTARPARVKQLLPMIPRALEALDTAKPGDTIEIGNAPLGVIEQS
ncbi:MAG: hypothetical protein AAGG99_05570 [Pseudomonadota bacterium]